MVGKSCKRLRLLLVFETSKVTTGSHHKKKVNYWPGQSARTSSIYKNSQQSKKSLAQKHTTTGKMKALGCNNTAGPATVEKVPRLAKKLKWARLMMLPDLDFMKSKSTETQTNPYYKAPNWVVIRYSLRSFLVRI